MVNLISHKIDSNKLDKDKSIRVTTEMENLNNYVIATGDFNNDKIQDVLIRIDWHTIGAFWKGSMLVAAARHSEREKLELINRKEIPIR